MSAYHAGDVDDHVKSSTSVHCTRTGLPTSFDRMAASAIAPSPPYVVRPYCPGPCAQRIVTFSTGTPMMCAMWARAPCDCDVCDQTGIDPSPFTSATATY